MTDKNEKKTSDMSYDDFVQYMVQQIADGIITKGFSSIRSNVNQMITIKAQIDREGGFAPRR
jgi:hypothetical protein